MLAIADVNLIRTAFVLSFANSRNSHSFFLAGLKQTSRSL
jgi:hypothetical protein